MFTVHIVTATSLTIATISNSRDLKIIHISDSFVSLFYTPPEFCMNKKKNQKILHTVKLANKEVLGTKV